MAVSASSYGVWVVALQSSIPRACLPRALTRPSPDKCLVLDVGSSPRWNAAATSSKDPLDKDLGRALRLLPVKVGVCPLCISSGPGSFTETSATSSRVMLPFCSATISSVTSVLMDSLLGGVLLGFSRCLIGVSTARRPSMELSYIDQLLNLSFMALKGSPVPGCSTRSQFVAELLRVVGTYHLSPLPARY